MKYLSKKQAQKVILKAVNKLADAVKRTYGPASNKVLISKSIYKLIVDDGVSVARDFQTQDDAENAILNAIKEVAIRTSDRVGDGTTTSLLILRALIKEIRKERLFKKKSDREIEYELRNALEEAKKQLRDSAMMISSQADLKKVAKIAFNNEAIAETIADLFFQTGKEGFITIERSNSMESTSERVEGMGIQKGFISEWMKTNEQECELEDPYIVLTDYRITSNQDIIPIIEKMMVDPATGQLRQDKRPFVIFCENIEGDALSTLFINRVKNIFFGAAVALSDDRKEILQDLHLVTGGTILNTESGKTAKTLELSDLGHAKKVIIRHSETVIVGGQGDKEKLDGIIKILRKGIEECPLHEKAKHEKHLARLTNGISVINIGAPTEGEQKALMPKVKNAVNATKLAFNSGVVPGAGLALAKIETSSNIFNRALKAPNRQLIENSGKIAGTIEESDNVIDPVEVLCSGLDSAVSITNLLTSISGLLIETPIEDERRKNAR